MMKSKGQNIDDSIGSENATTAMTLLIQKNVNTLVAHVCEFGHRRLVFDTSSGHDWVRHTDSEGKGHTLNGKV